MKKTKEPFNTGSAQVRKRKGFTLTEVLVVVLVIGVISAIAYPVYTKAITKSRAVEAINLLEMVRNKQIAYHARNAAYLEDFKDMGQLTNSPDDEKRLGTKLEIGKYELTINPEASCMTAAYRNAPGKDPVFVFSSSYEDSGLGCEGSICSSFGGIIGGPESVCNCKDKDCGSGFDMDPISCACSCSLECNQNGACFNKSQNKPTSQDCGNGGTQTRTCEPSCDNGTCSGWGQCTGQSCGAAPATSRACGNCGTETATINCNGNTGSWEINWSGKCEGQGVCEKNKTEPCGNGGTRTCNSSCGWGACENEGECKAGETEEQPCDGTTGKKVRTCSALYKWGEWDTSACGCPAGQCLTKIYGGSLECRSQSQGKQYDGKCYYNCDEWTCNDGTGWTCSSKNYKAYNDCNPGETETALCDDGKNNKTRTCSERCGWGEWDISTCGCAPNTCRDSSGTCRTKSTGKQYNGKCYYYCEDWQCNEGRGWTCVKKRFEGNDKQKGSVNVHTSSTHSSSQPSGGVCLSANCTSNRNTTIGKAIIAANGNWDGDALCVSYCAGASGTPAGVVKCDGTYTWHYYDFYNPCPKEANGSYRCTTYTLTCVKEVGDTSHCE